jgi:hypothetical protein
MLERADSQLTVALDRHRESAGQRLWATDLRWMRRF